MTRIAITVLALVASCAGPEDQPTPEPNDPSCDATACSSTGPPDAPTTTDDGSSSSTGALGTSTGETTDDGSSSGASSTGDAQFTGRRVFVTSWLLSPTSAAGPESADALCEQLAADAGLPGAFASWTSTTEASGDVLAPVHARDRIHLDHLAPYFLVDDETLVLAAGADATSGSLLHPIDLDELGGGVGVSGRVWTGTTPDGSSGVDCDGWTSSASLGLAGDVTASDGGWTAAGGLACTGWWRAYCFEVVQ